MKTVLFCIPLKSGCLAQFKAFVKETSEHKSKEWKEMLARYDMSCVKINAAATQLLELFV